MIEISIPHEFLNENLSKYKELFDPQIRMRGEHYFRNGNVQAVYKKSNTNSYIAKVEGQEVYTTIIEQKENGELQMSCSCPYWENCKHEWATILNIENGMFKEVDLRPVQNNKIITIDELVKKIPAAKLKKYIIENSFENSIDIDIDDLEDEFLEYLPQNDYDYYYNNLFNSIEINDYYKIIINSYLIELKQYIDIKEYNVSFNIIKAIIEISNDKQIDITEQIPQLAMYFRISHNKTKNNDKYIETNKNIKNYIKYLKNNNYYDNVYIEDMINTVK